MVWLNLTSHQNWMIWYDLILKISKIVGPITGIPLSQVFKDKKGKKEGPRLSVAWWKSWDHLVRRAPSLVALLDLLTEQGDLGYLGIFNVQWCCSTMDDLGNTKCSVWLHPWCRFWRRLARNQRCVISFPIMYSKLSLFGSNQMFRDTHMLYSRLLMWGDFNPVPPWKASDGDWQPQRIRRDCPKMGDKGCPKIPLWMGQMMINHGLGLSLFWLATLLATP